MTRLAGLFYLITSLTGGFAEIGVRGNLIVSGDAATTARNVLALDGIGEISLMLWLLVMGVKVATSNRQSTSS